MLATSPGGKDETDFCNHCSGGLVRGRLAVFTRRAGAREQSGDGRAEAPDVPQHRTDEPGWPYFGHHRRPWRSLHVLRVWRERWRLEDGERWNDVEAALRQSERAVDRRDRA